MNAAILACAVLLAPPQNLRPSEWPDDYRELVEAHTASYVAQQRQALKDVTSEALRNRGGVGYADRIKTLKRRVKEVSRKGFYLEPLLFSDALAKGQMGKFGAKEFQVQQVIDGETALLRPIGEQTYVETIDGRTATSATSANSVVRKKEVIGKPFLLRGIDTDDWSDDDRIRRLDGVYRVLDTETYETVGGGTNTVFVIEPIRPKPKDDE